MNNNIIFRRATNNSDRNNIINLLYRVFAPQRVDELADVFFQHFPGLENKNWFVAENTDTKEIVSVFVLIPWTWEMNGIELKVAEKGLVGTDEKYRNRGIMKSLSRTLDDELLRGGYDLAVIQGIPGFYHRLGYHYAVPLANHINLPLHVIPDVCPDSLFDFRIAGDKDIPFLMKADDLYRAGRFISAKRSERSWRYIIRESRETECGSDIVIMTRKKSSEAYYFRAPFHGFGNGLILSEASENMTSEALAAMFVYVRNEAVKKGKPYIRLDLPCDSPAAVTALSAGALEEPSYAWQVKIPDKVRLLEKMKPVFEKRMAESCFRTFSGRLCFDFYTEQVTLSWANGKLIGARREGCQEAEAVFHIASDLFPSLCLGHRTWRELRHNRPDIFPSDLYIRMNPKRSADPSGMLFDVLFPAERSWCYLNY